MSSPAAEEDMSGFAKFLRDAMPWILFNGIVSVIVVAIIIERLIYFLGKGAVNAKAFLEQIRKPVAANNVDRAIKLCSATEAPVARVAKADATVLLQGESGTGKELVAKAIHDASRRASAPFVTVDCSGLPEALIESELFGHERGAFTGATTRRTGLVEAALGGTLFLDEVGDVPLAMQVKLLRLLETGTYRRVGSSELSHADVRLVSATHRDLRAMVAAGQFRQDLYFRLNTFPIRLPPLRDRKADLVPLVDALLQRVAPGRGLSLAPRAAQLLERHDYPGNVRELRNILERASLLCDGDVIQAAHLPEELRASVNAVPGPVGAVDAELTALRRRLATHGGSRKALAKELGVSERTLYRRLKRLAGD